jgi:hypothetical protein
MLLAQQVLYHLSKSTFCGKRGGSRILKTWEDIADEAKRLLEMKKAGQDATEEDNDTGEQDDDQEAERDGTDPYDEVIFGRRRRDSFVVDWTNKVLFILGFKRTSDSRRDYNEQGESRISSKSPT